ncbi:MAG: DNA polymerase III subunit gamma/tau [Helicobacteraceae bacterium]|jgi:DNA polymerase-3 subunit gamma/tau|nr:DNA polymerase III subunit gamma/tau [Helicobacteraceae bacterium]
MSEHRVLALKYRPRSFKELIGQEAVSQTLSLALDNGKLSHAYLFSGLRGSGKTSSARIFAKSLLCEKGVSSAPCEECDNCRQANEGRHIDIIEMDAASNTGVDDVRDLIEQTKYAPSVGRFKIYIIDEVHMLSKGAFNALLKTLEEPPSYIKFLLATTDPMKVPSTILSRSQHFRFKKIAFESVLAHIKHIMARESIQADDRALEIIARSGGGSMRDTLTLLEQAIAYGKGALELNAAVEMLGVLDPAQIEAFFARVFDRDVGGAIEFVKEVESSDAEMVVGELIGFLKEKLFKPRAPFSASVIERFFKIAAEAKTLLHYGADGGFALGLTALKMIEALRPEEVSEAIERIENELSHQAPSAESAAPKTAAITQIAPSQTRAEKPAIAPRQTQIEKLRARLYDRSVELGSAFSESVKFIGFENDEFRAVFAESGEAVERLRKDYKVFLQILREVFGARTKIVKIAAPIAQDQIGEARINANSDDSQLPRNENLARAENQSAADSNASGNVAASRNADGDLSVIAASPSQDDRDIPAAPAAILDDPLDDPNVKKAIEIFQPEKITVVTKN